MLGALAIVAGVRSTTCACLMKGQSQECPSVSVRLFHQAIAAGRLGEIGNLFSFASAYAYWQEVATSMGFGCPGEEAFRRELLDAFAGDMARAEVSSYTPLGFKVKIIEAVASVVFMKSSDGAEGEFAASAVREDGCWKVRTYPGVFPGEMLSAVLRGAGRESRGGSCEK